MILDETALWWVPYGGRTVTNLLTSGGFAQV